jgi:TusA-related sulfurtransferase
MAAQTRRRPPGTAAITSAASYAAATLTFLGVPGVMPAPMRSPGVARAPIHVATALDPGSHVDHLAGIAHRRAKRQGPMSADRYSAVDMRGKAITTFIACTAARRLAEVAEGEALQLLTDAGDAIDNDIRAWYRATRQELVSTERSDSTCRYVIATQSLAVFPGTGGTRPDQRPHGETARGNCTGRRRPFGRFARTGLAKAGHIPAPERIQPAADARRPPPSLRTIDAALQGSEVRPGLRRRDHCGIPDLNGGHGKRRHLRVRPVATPHDTGRFQLPAALGMRPRRTLALCRA